MVSKSSLGFSQSQLVQYCETFFEELEDGAKWLNASDLELTASKVVHEVVIGDDFGFSTSRARLLFRRGALRCVFSLHRGFLLSQGKQAIALLSAYILHI